MGEDGTRASRSSNSPQFITQTKSGVRLSSSCKGQVNHIPSPISDRLLDMNDNRPRIHRGLCHRCQRDVVDIRLMGIETPWGE
jgi:hypothetical protein